MVREMIATAGKTAGVESQSGAPLDVAGAFPALVYCDIHRGLPVRRFLGSSAGGRVRVAVQKNDNKTSTTSPMATSSASSRYLHGCKWKFNPPSRRISDIVPSENGRRRFRLGSVVDKQPLRMGDDAAIELLFIGWFPGTVRFRGCFDDLLLNVDMILGGALHCSIDVLVCSFLLQTTAFISFYQLLSCSFYLLFPAKFHSTIVVNCLSVGL